MPTSIRRGAVGLSQLEQDAFPATYRPNDVLIGTWSQCAVGNEIATILNLSAGSQTYPAASRVLAFPFAIADYFLVRKTWWVNGTTATTDTADVGVYSEAGTTLIVHAGAAIATANVVQEGDPTDTLLAPGRYWCAYVQGGVTATPFGFLAGSALNWRAMGCAQMAGSGSTLGATFTPAAIASTAFPLFGIAGRTQVA